MTDYLDNDISELINTRSCKCCITKKINISKEVDPNKSNNSQEYMICDYWSFNHGFKFKHSIRNGFKI